MAGAASATQPRPRQLGWLHLPVGTRLRLTGYGLLLPACLIVLGLVAYPTLYTVALSFTNAKGFRGPGDFTGLTNYRILFDDPEFWTAARNTVILGATTVLIEVIFGLVTALLLWWKFWGRSLLFIAVFVPWVYPAAFSGFAWFWIFPPPFHTFYQLDAVRLKLFVDSHVGPGWWGFSSIVVVNVWRCSSFIAIFVLAALNAIPAELLEYARIETKSAWQRFRFVVLPFIWSFLVLAALIAIVVTYIDFTNVYIQSGGRFYEPLLLTQAYSTSILHGFTGLGAAINVVQFPFIAILLWVGFSVIDRLPASHTLPLDKVASPTTITGENQRAKDFWKTGASQRSSGAEVPALGAGSSLPAALSTPTSPRLQRRLLISLGGFFALLVAVFHIFPIYWTVIQAIRPMSEDPGGNSLWSSHPSLAAFSEVIGNGRFWVWMRNTGVIFGVALVLTIICSLLAGYALARFALPGGRWIARLLFASYFIPQTAIIVPIYRVYLLLGIVDSSLSVILLYLTLTIPFSVWLFYIYFRGLPADLEENALLDGNRPAVFRHVVLRMSWPVIVAAGIFSIGVMASDLLYANIFLIHHGQQTVIQGLGVLEIDLDEFNTLTGGLGLGALPIVLIAAAFAPSYVRGLTTAMIEGA
ncbi:MAG: ABC transporter permease subunit [Dehalococcoidia bacterium]